MTDEQLLTRPRAKLSTVIGRLIDKTTYESLAVLLIVIIVYSALFYWALTPFDNGTSSKDISIGDSLYFSVVTLCTVGYGEIHPVGLGKGVAVFEILSGVILVSLLVGKVASERQSALLLLIYTSEQQKRLQDFVLGINSMIDKIEFSLTNHHHLETYELSKQCYNYIASISNFLIFQSNQGRLASFGNQSSLRLIYKTIYKVQLLALEAIQLTTTDEKAINYFLWINQKINYIGIKMVEFHQNDPKTLKYLQDITILSNKIIKFEEERSKGLAAPYYRNIITVSLLDRVHNVLPPKPWKKHIHKDVAAQLKLSNKLAHKCINELVITGKV